MASLSDEAVTVAYLRSVTDKDAEAQLRHPMLWAYVVRDPTGAICSHGHGKTRKECEERAVVHAAECADEAWPESRMWLASKWRFLTWPPKNATRQRDRAIDLKEPRVPEVKKSRDQRLSQPQIIVLLLGVDLKLSRSSMGWSYDDRMRSEDPIRIYSPATIKSLYERGLLDANFSDSRILRGELGGCRLLMERAMNIHQKFPNFRCGLAPLGERFSRIRACSLTIASCSTTEGCIHD